MIVGSTGIGFTANDFSVTKVSNIPAISGSSFVEVSGSVAWWNLEGIYILSQQSGAVSSPSVQSITEQTIKTYYNQIPPSAKRRAQGWYNANEGTVQWLYREGEAADPTELYEGTHILNLDVLSNAFYKWSLPDDEDSPKIHSVFVLENIGGAPPTQEEVTAEGLSVTVDGEDVTVFNISNLVNSPKFKYVTSVPTESGFDFTFSEAWDEDYEDFASVEAQDFTSYFVTGYKIYAEGLRKFQAPYVSILSKGPESTSYKFNGRWNYANSGNSGKWSTQELVTHSDTNLDFHRRRHKLRGFGRALQFKVTSVPGEPFDIAGWSTYVLGNQQL
jgi:hypothetical protein